MWRVSSALVLHRMVFLIWAPSFPDICKKLRGGPGFCKKKDDVLFRMSVSRVQIRVQRPKKHKE